MSNAKKKDPIDRFLEKYSSLYIYDDDREYTPKAETEVGDSVPKDIESLKALLALIN